MRIDWWTLGLQTVNVLVLVWILSRFLFRPVASIIERRQAVAAKLLADAEEAKSQANSAREAAEAETARLMGTRSEALRAAAAEADTERAAALAAARTEVEHLRSAAEAEIERERQAEAARPRPIARRGSRSTSLASCLTACRTRSASTALSTGWLKRSPRCRPPARTGSARTRTRG